MYPDPRRIDMSRDENGYWHAEVNKIPPGTRYKYLLDGEAFADPVSHFQPEGVHGASEVVDHSGFHWKDDNWQPPEMDQLVIYELHVGTFSDKGDFAGIEDNLDYLISLGINAIEIMPVAQFPGNRNWGYDGVYPFAVHDSYGGPEGLKKLVNACHQKGLAVILDVVYNHLGPEGNYLEKYAPYFTTKYNTPWGKALNFDDDYCDDVRNYFINNALHWFDNYHIDGLRLDAIHAIYDLSAYPFLRELKDKTNQFNREKNRNHFLISESGLNDTKVIRNADQGGFDHDAQWSDDYHHAIHTLLTGENMGYYMDYGKPEDLVKALAKGFVYDGIYSRFRKKRYGNPSNEVYPGKFVIFNQNHDQTGNRMKGERLTHLVSFEMLKAAAGMYLLSPYIPMLFMGEEYGEDNPFLYFVSHGDPNLVEAVRMGRKEEFKDFQWQGVVPDPQAVKTFNKSKLNWDLLNKEKNRALYTFYQYLIALRKKGKAYGVVDREGLMVKNENGSRFFVINKKKLEEELIILINFEAVEHVFSPEKTLVPMNKVLDSSEKEWRGPGNDLPDKTNFDKDLTLKPNSIVVYEKELL
jgi:maltooligosyltrehalose trehalohydrolase